MSDIQEIDPHAITDGYRTDAELEQFLVFCICVAGKTAVIMARKVFNFFDQSGYNGSPFEIIQQMERDQVLSEHLRRHGIGKYGLLEKTLPALASAGLDLRTCSTHDLEAFGGIGHKTSRFFIVHSRPIENRYAIIDTHIMKYLRSIGVQVPKTLTSASYLRLEQSMLDEARRLNKSINTLDLEIWSHYASGKDGDPVY